LAKLDVAQLEVAHVERLRRLIRDKKFRRYLIKKCYPIALIIIIFSSQISRHHFQQITPSNVLGSELLRRIGETSAPIGMMAALEVIYPLFGISPTMIWWW
jgi:hypothetical protein